MTSKASRAKPTTEKRERDELEERLGLRDLFVRYHSRATKIDNPEDVYDWMFDLAQEVADAAREEGRRAMTSDPKDQDWREKMVQDMATTLDDADSLAGPYDIPGFLRNIARLAALRDLIAAVEKRTLAHACAPDTHDERRYLSAIQDARCHDTSEEADAETLFVIRTIIKNTREAVAKEADAEVARLDPKWRQQAAYRAALQVFAENVRKNLNRKESRP